MLALSDRAADRLKTLVEETPGLSGLRVARTRDPDAPLEDGPAMTVGLELAGRPWATDEIIIDKGVCVFVEPGLARFLEDKRLEVDEEGGEPTFHLVARLPSSDS